MNIYKKKSLDINQGDIVILGKEDYKEIFNIDEKDIDNIRGLMVLSNSCDIYQEKIEYISFSPIIELEFFAISLFEKKLEEEFETIKEQIGFKKIKRLIEKKIELIKKFEHPKYFYLPKRRYYHINKELIVLLEAKLSIQFEEVCEIVNNNTICSLKSPWKEKLGWKIGYLHDRISLEELNK